MQLREAESPVAFFVNGIGDHMLALPAIRALASLWPGKLTLICPQGARDLFFSDAPIRRAVEPYIWDLNGRWAFDAARLAADVGACDWFLSLVAWNSPELSELVGRLAPQQSVGFRDYFRTTLERNYRKHTAELAFDVPRALDSTLRLDAFSAPPQFPARAHASASRVLLALPADAAVLLVHPETAPPKMLARGVLGSALHRFLGAHPEFFVLLVGRTDPLLRRGEHDDRIIPCHGLPLSVSLSLVSKADLFLGVDSCMLHAADFFRVPGVGLFGPTWSGEFGFRFSDHHRHVEPGNTMVQITSDDIVEALDAVWAESGHHPSPSRHVLDPAREPFQVAE